MPSRNENAQVDMLAEARNAQWSAKTFMGEDVVKALAPAKVNLFLGIGERMSNGYHKVDTVMHSLSLHDTLFFSCSEGHIEDKGCAYAGESGSVQVSIELVDKVSSFAPIKGLSSSFGDIETKNNLVFKAIDELVRKIDFSEEVSIKARMEKNIPSQAGLGGGSSDAAAALSVLGILLKREIDGAILDEVAESIGADVKFFLQGGCALLTGYGEHIERELGIMKHPIVLVRPDKGVPTSEAYAHFDENPIKVPELLLNEALNARNADEVPLFNNLEPAACGIVPEIKEVIEWLKRDESVMERSLKGEPSSRCALMSGSGSCVFAITDTYSSATSLAAEARAKGWWARATYFSSLAACSMAS